MTADNVDQPAASKAPEKSQGFSKYARFAFALVPLVALWELVAHARIVRSVPTEGDWRSAHDWIAREGSFVYEPPGEIHTLVVDEASGGSPEMITFFNIAGAMVYVDATGAVTSYEDVFTKIEMCRTHYTAVGLGRDFVALGGGVFAARRAGFPFFELETA